MTDPDVLFAKAIANFKTRFHFGKKKLRVRVRIDNNTGSYQELLSSSMFFSREEVLVKAKEMFLKRQEFKPFVKMVSIKITLEKP